MGKLEHCTGQQQISKYNIYKEMVWGILPYFLLFQSKSFVIHFEVLLKNFQVDSTAFKKVIEWLYSGQVKLTIPQCDDVIRLCKHCKLDQLKDEIQYAMAKANSFGKLIVICLSQNSTFREI